MSEPLRELLAQFVVEVDKAGALAAGNEAVDELKRKLQVLEAEFARVKAPAAAAGMAIERAFTAPVVRAVAVAEVAATRIRGLLGVGSGGGAGGLVLAGAGGALARTGGAGGGGALPPGGGVAGLLGDGTGGSALGGRWGALARTESPLDALRGFTFAEPAAARLAGTLRDKLATAVGYVRQGFEGGGGGKGPGLIATLATARNGLIALGAGAVAAGVRRLVDGIGDIEDTAARLGVTNAEVQRLGALAKVSGSDVGALGAAFRTLGKNAVAGTDETTEAFYNLGVETKRADGSFKSRQDLFFETAGALADVGDETERATLAQKLFGNSAVALAPLLAKGRGALEEQRKELEKLPVLSDRTIAAAADLGDQWDLAGGRILKAAEPLIQLLIPALTKLTEWAMKGVDAVGKWLKQTDLVAVGLTALGGYLGLRFIPMLQLLVGLGGGAGRVFLTMAGAASKAAAQFLKLAVPLLLLEDFIVFLRGGDSLLGRTLDTVFGDGAAAGTLKALKDLAEAFQDLWRWIMGNGQGEKVQALYAEVAEGLGLLRHDALVKLGIRKGTTGLEGQAAYEAGKEGTGLTRLGKFLGGTDPSDPMVQFLTTRAEERRGEPTTIINANGDRVVNVTLPPGSTARDVAPAVSRVLERGRDSIPAN